MRIEKLLDKRRREHKIEYLVKWEGLPEDKASWEHVSKLSGTLLPL